MARSRRQAATARLPQPSPRAFAILAGEDHAGCRVRGADCGQVVPEGGDALFRARTGMPAFAQTPVLPKAPSVGVLSAQSGNCWLEERLGVDPLLPHRTGPMKGREALESGLCQKAWVARKGDIELALC
jgi:hypothetical protein